MDIRAGIADENYSTIQYVFKLLTSSGETCKEVSEAIQNLFIPNHSERCELMMMLMTSN